MREGWVKDDYLILFEDEECRVASERHPFPELLPGYRLLGLRNWDDFIVSDDAGHVFCVCTVPVSANHLAPFELPDANETWIADERFKGRIKWYVKPLVFGGDAASPHNQTWISHDEHARLVRFWNSTYRSIQAKGE